MPAPVTMTSPLRPRKRRSPAALRSARSPVGEPLAFAAVHCAGLPRRAGEHVAAHQDFALLGDTHFAAGERLADRPRRDVEGMIQRDQRGRLGHTIALDERQAEAVPEGFEIAGQGGAAGDDGPELPSQARDGCGGSATICWRAQGRPSPRSVPRAAPPARGNAPADEPEADAARAAQRSVPRCVRGESGRSCGMVRAAERSVLPQ